MTSTAQRTSRTSSQKHELTAHGNCLTEAERTKIVSGLHIAARHYCEEMEAAELLEPTPERKRLLKALDEEMAATLRLAIRLDRAGVIMLGDTSSAHPQTVKRSSQMKPQAKGHYA